jgi:hypothetical protein
MPPRRSQMGHKQSQGWRMGFWMGRTDFWGLAATVFGAASPAEVGLPGSAAGSLQDRRSLSCI